MGGSRRREDPPPCPPVNDNIAVLQPMRTNETHNQTSLITSPIEYSKVREKHHTMKNRTPGGWGISMCLCVEPTRTDLVRTFSWEIPVVGLWIYTLLDVFFNDFKSILIWATAKLYKVAFYVNRLKLVKTWFWGHDALMVKSIQAYMIIWNTCQEIPRRTTWNRRRRTCLSFDNDQHVEFCFWVNI
jgi:hypothetical protein